MADVQDALELLSAELGRFSALNNSARGREVDWIELSITDQPGGHLCAHLRPLRKGDGDATMMSMVRQEQQTEVFMDMMGGMEEVAQVLSGRKPVAWSYLDEM